MSLPSPVYLWFVKRKATKWHRKKSALALCSDTELSLLGRETAVFGCRNKRGNASLPLPSGKSTWCFIMPVRSSRYPKNIHHEGRI